MSDDHADAYMNMRSCRLADVTHIGRIARSPLQGPRICVVGLVSEPGAVLCDSFGRGRSWSGSVAASRAAF